MQVKYRPTHAEIDLDALEANFLALRRRLPADMKLLACVKANAYGHGAVPVAKELERIGADYLSVAFLDEALELRSAGIKLPILVLGYTPPHGVRTAWEHDITLNVFSEEVLEEIATLDPAEFPHKLKVHVKIDSGMGRLGLLPGDGAVAFVRKALQIPQVEVEGLFTHFATADDADKSYTLEQFSRFQGVVNALREHEIEIPIIHTGNSAISIDLPELSLRMARIGIALYGLYPSDEVRKDEVQLHPGAVAQNAVGLGENAAPSFRGQLWGEIRNPAGGADRHPADRLRGRVFPDAERQGASTDTRAPRPCGRNDLHGPMYGFASNFG